MTSYAATMDAPPTLVEHYRQTASEAADSVARAIRDTLAHYTRPRLAQMGAEIVNLLAQQGRPDPGVNPVDAHTVLAAIAFVRL
jgi:hypothetical protein